MPVQSDLPPFLSRSPLRGLREKIETALSRPLDECVALRASLSKLAPHLSADLGYPTKKLTLEERAILRVMERAKVDADDLAGMIRWLDGVIQAARLRHARAA